MFNNDMDRRLADLWDSVAAGEPFTTEFATAFNGLPDRVIYNLVGGRRFVFDIPMSRGLAEQLQANGAGELAAPILAVLP